MTVAGIPSKIEQMLAFHEALPVNFPAVFFFDADGPLVQQIPNGVDVKEPKIPQGTLALASETGHRTGGFLRLPALGRSDRNTRYRVRNGVWRLGATGNLCDSSPVLYAAKLSTCIR